MNPRLQRTRNDTVIGGVCGGLGRYFGLDPVWIRLLFVLLALGDGVGVLIYIILWIAMPWDVQVADNALREELRQAGENVEYTARSPGSMGLIIGGALVIFGIFMLIQQLNIPWLWWLRLDVLWPLLLVVSGFFVLLRSVKRG